MSEYTIKAMVRCDLNGNEHVPIEGLERVHVNFYMETLRGHEYMFLLYKENSFGKFYKCEEEPYITWHESWLIFGDQKKVKCHHCGEINYL